MNDLSTYREQLPDTLEDLSRFVLVSEERVQALKAEIRAIKKVSLAKEVYEQKLAEAQEFSEVTVLAQQKVGELLLQIQKDTSFHGNQHKEVNPHHTETPKTKGEITAEMGMTSQQVSQYQQMAQNPEAVQTAIEKARESGDVVSRNQVMKEIRNRPFVTNNSGNNEWYTPEPIIELARSAMGGITLDPASSEVANQTVQAESYFTVEDNGLEKEWFGNVWLNPPYSAELIGKFSEKLIAERENYEQAIVLVNNATETEWFNKVVSIASAVCFPKGRIRYYSPEKVSNTPLQGQALLYIGNDVKSFVKQFASVGWVAYGIYR